MAYIVGLLILSNSTTGDSREDDPIEYRINISVTLDQDIGPTSCDIRGHTVNTRILIFQYAIIIFKGRRIIANKYI